MLFPRAAVASTAELPAGAFDDPAGATGSSVSGAVPAAGGAPAMAALGDPGVALGCALARAIEDDPGGVEEADVPPRLLT
jgi:hypothetical protein